MKTSLLLLALTLINLLLFGVALHAQQEVDASWYNPWPEAKKMAAHSAEPLATQEKAQVRKISSASKRQAAKLQVGDSAGTGTNHKLQVRTVSLEQVQIAGMK